MTTYRSNGNGELSLRQRRLVSGEIAREFRAWRRKKGEPSEADRQQIIAIGFAKARRRMPSIPNSPQENPGVLAAAIGGMTGAIVMNALSNPRPKSNPSTAVMVSDDMGELQDAAHAALDPVQVYWVITGPIKGLYKLRVYDTDESRAVDLLRPLTMKQSVLYAENPVGASVGQPSPDHPGFLFYGNLYSDSSRTRMTLDAFKDAGIGYIAEGGGNLLDVYIRRSDWDRALIAANGVSGNPLTDHEKRLLEMKAAGWDKEEQRSDWQSSKNYYRGRATEARDVAAWGGISANPAPRQNSHLEGEPCDVCGGPLNFMGTLGNVEWYRCRNCGMEIQSQAPRSNPLTGGEVGEIEADAKSYIMQSYGGGYDMMDKASTIGRAEGMKEVARKYGPRPRGNPLNQRELDAIRDREQHYIALQQRYEVMGGEGDDRTAAQFSGAAQGSRMIREKYRAPGARFEPNPMLMTVMGANPGQRRRRVAARSNPSGPRRKTTMSLEKFAKFVKSKNDPKLWAAFVKKVRGYQKWTHGSMPKNVTVETMNVPGVSGLWMTYGMGREPEKVYVMPKGSKRKGAWKHPWGKMPYLKGDPEAGVIITKLVPGNRITDFLHG